MEEPARFKDPSGTRNLPERGVAMVLETAQADSEGAAIEQGDELGEKV